MSSDSDTPLRLFLQASMLSTDVAADNNDDGKGVRVLSPLTYFSMPIADWHRPMQKVTLTTCHAAKGLEWPVVFIPAGTSN